MPLNLTILFGYLVIGLMLAAWIVSCGMDRCARWLRAVAAVVIVVGWPVPVTFAALCLVVGFPLAFLISAIRQEAPRANGGA